MSFGSKIALTFGAIAMAGVAFASGHGGPSPISARKAHMRLYEFNVSVLGSMATGRTEYNAELAAFMAQDLAKLTTFNQRGYWPQGSDNENAEGTRALPALWENFPDVFEKAQALGAAAAAMEAAAGEGLPALQAAMGPLGSACNDCHRSYRARAN